MPGPPADRAGDWVGQWAKPSRGAREGQATLTWLKKLRRGIEAAGSGRAAPTLLENVPLLQVPATAFRAVDLGLRGP